MHAALKFNRIDWFKDSHVSKLTELKVIDLRNSQLSIIEGSFDRNTKLESIHLQNNPYLTCNIFELLERSVRVDVALGPFRGLSTECMGSKLKISVENEEMVIRSTDGNKELMRINKTSLSNLGLVYFGANQLTDVTAILNMLGSSIVALKLSGNFIGKLNATTFQRFTELKHLYLGRTNLSEMDGNPLENLIHLEVLDLSDNDLQHLDINLLSSTLGQLHHFAAAGSNIANVNEMIQYMGGNIEWLYLSRNFVGKLNLNTIQALSNLEELHLSQTHLSDIDFAQFKQLPKLSRLDISGNANLRTLNITQLLSLGQLKKFNISGNQMENTQEVVRHLPLSVNNLDVSDNYLGVIEKEAFSKLVYLKILNLRHTNLTNFDIKTMNPHLEELDISKNDLANADLSSVDSFERLNILNMNWNNLTELKGLTRQTYPRLKYLHIEGNRLSCEYIYDLKKTQSWDSLKVIGDCNNQTEVDDGHSTT